MKVSLIITCANRQRELDRFARGIAEQQSDCEVEVIYIRQGSAQLKIPDGHLDSLRIITHDVGRQLSLSAARNIGLRECSGDIIAFPDDDCWYAPKLLDEVTSFLRRNPGVDCICTNVFDPESGCSLVRQPVGVIKSISFRNVFQLVNSSAIFIRREALAKFGGWFDERLGVGAAIGSGEETEFVARALRKSLAVQYVGTIQVFHPVIQYLDANLGKEYSYNVGFGVLNAWLLRDGEYAVLYHYVRSLLRSAAGILVYIGVPAKRGTYWSRLRGMLLGLAMGFRGNGSLMGACGQEVHAKADER